MSSELISALIGLVVGFILGGFKFFWEAWLPSRLTWKREQKVGREKFLSEFRDPAMRAASDLQSRVYRVLELGGTGPKEYFVASTAFLVAQYFAWAEILRRKAGMLDYGDLVDRLDAVTHGFAYGDPDFQIFRLEQREVGERMIVPSGEPAAAQAMGYSEFIDRLGQEECPRCFKELRTKAQGLYGSVHSSHPPLPEDRLTTIQHALVDLMDFIDPEGRWVPKDERMKVRRAD